LEQGRKSEEVCGAAAPLLTNYCPFPTKVEKKDSKDRKYVVFIDSGVGISVDGDPEATDTHCGTVG